jgi:hypothetical protein
LRALNVSSWFQAFAFKCNLHRYAVYRNSAGVWDVFISIVSDFFLTMVSFGGAVQVESS